MDVGVASPLVMPDVIDAKVRAGTANMVLEDAMSRDEALAALQVGGEAVERAVQAGAKCIIVGEMGIANTTSSSAMLAALTGRPVAQLVGTGTGINSAQQAHKVAV